MRRLFPRSLFEYAIFVFISFLLGVAAHSVFPFVVLPVVPLASALCLLGVLTWFSWRKGRGFVVVLALASFVFGLWRFDATIPRGSDGLRPWNGREIRLEGRVAEAEAAARGGTATVSVERAGSENVSGPGARVAFRLSGTVPAVGDQISFICRVLPSKTSSFFPRRRESLAKRGIWFECAATVKAWMRLSSAPWWDMTAVLSRWRIFLSRRIDGLFPSSEAELLKGMLYGDADFSEEERDRFARAGLMHLVAVSGSNLTFVVHFLFLLAGILSWPRRRAFWLITFGISVFVIFVGAGASVIRAALMGWLVALARETGRVVHGGYALLLVAAVMALLNPWRLAFDAGFALSFLAMYGLIAWSPLFESLLSRVPSVAGLRQTAAATASATLLTTPYLAWAFGQISFAGLVTNLFAVPLVPWIMMGGALAAAWGAWPGHVFFDLPVSGLLRAVLLIARFADEVPWFSRRIVFPFWFMAATYLLLVVLWKRLVWWKETSEREKNERKATEEIFRLSRRDDRGRRR